ncbi:hypothetical protein B0T19DRAFT_484097 [Cercophora scortea]|uniref:Uncharacterized protein n=1 Tax=Cercophora scortea TaxID=314031 RepID=A0AAE0J0C9_9PEZI|nr:hypothetical protein B0T19DRAFT_484097 [Cercophora scortea]
MPTTVLITGANRGIGRGLTEFFLSRPDHIVIAAVRDPSSPSAVSLTSVPVGSGTKLLLVKIDSKSDTDPAEAIATITAAGVDHLDIVIANAGIANYFSKVDGIDLKEFRDLFEVNTHGPLKLLKAAFPLLKATKDKNGAAAPKFVGISTNAASIADLEENEPYLLGAYGASKAALNYLVRRAHTENDWLTAFVINPGFAQTDMGNAGAKFFGLEQAVVTVKDSVEGILKVIDSGTRQSVSGRFLQYDGVELKY